MAAQPPPVRTPMGRESRLAAGRLFQFIPDIEWTADGAALVFTAGEIRTGLYAVDPHAGSLEESRRLGPGPRAASGHHVMGTGRRPRRQPTRRGRDLLRSTTRGALAHRRCRRDRGRHPGSLLPGERIEATDLDSDQNAERLLIVVGGGPGGGELVRWDGTGDPEQISDGIIVAAW